MKFVIVFLAMAALDALWTYYTQAVQRKLAARAAALSAAIIAVGAFVTVSYVGDRRLVVAAVLGAYVGTWLAVWHDKRAARIVKEPQG